MGTSFQNSWWPCPRASAAQGSWAFLLWVLSEGAGVLYVLMAVAEAVVGKRLGSGPPGMWDCVRVTRGVSVRHAMMRYVGDRGVRCVFPGWHL